MDSDATNSEMTETHNASRFICRLTFYISIVTTAVFYTTACRRSPPEPPSLAAESPDYTDQFDDGTPGFLRLDSEQDRRAFRHWFTFLAESQYYRQPKRMTHEITDCAALIRFAYREALREHDGAWASELDLDAVPSEASVRKYTYPRTPLGAALFRVRPGPFAPSNLTDASYAQFADAHTLQQFNTHFVTRDIRLAQPGDLLFYRQLEQDLPFHAMLYLGRGNFEESGNWIVYHTGPLGGGPGEIRRPRVEELLRHPSPRWRPNVGNGNFLGVYRWNILR
jgi:uncharacterized protein YfaT (DUF1175 family)